MESLVERLIVLSVTGILLIVMLGYMFVGSPPEGTKIAHRSPLDPPMEVVSDIDPEAKRTSIADEYMKQSPKPVDIQFWNGNKQIMSITGSGELEFNRKEFPNYTPDDFSKKFIEALRENWLKCQCAIQ